MSAATCTPGVESAAALCGRSQGGCCLLLPAGGGWCTAGRRSAMDLGWLAGKSAGAALQAVPLPPRLPLPSLSTGMAMPMSAAGAQSLIHGGQGGMGGVGGGSAGGNPMLGGNGQGGVLPVDPQVGCCCVGLSNGMQVLPAPFTCAASPAQLLA